MSLYADYLTERTSDQIIETEFGFATFRYLNEGKSVYLIDLFVAPRLRHEGYATHLADRVEERARAHGCLEMLGTVVPSTKGSTASLKVLMAYGMELQSASNDLIVFRKGI